MPSIKEEDPAVDKPLDQLLVATVPASNTTKSPSTTKEPDWRVPFIKYLTDGSGYTDRIENKRLMHRSKQYLLIDGKLWCKNAKEEILMKCIPREDGEHLLDKIHSSSCSNHAASRMLVGKAFRAGFYWPSAVADVEKLVHYCEGC
jgi:hypothetical protein